MTTLLPISPDASFCDVDDLWGNTDDACVTDPHANPAPRTTWLKDDSIVLSSNTKTLLCFSEWFDSCQPTPWCESNCYGNGPRFRRSSRAILIHNLEFMRALATAPQSRVDQVASQIVDTCQYYGIDNIRWHGVGDLHRGSNRVVVSIVSRYPAFTIWGFTRKARELLDLPVLDNLVFWGSVDRTMNEARLAGLCEAVAEHGTGLAFSSELGVRYRPRRHATPEVVGPRLRDQYDAELLAAEYGFYSWLEDFAADRDTKPCVSFGYHGRSCTTHLGLNSECPATDPLGGAHVRGTCQICRWCMTKRKPARTLCAHRSRIDMR